MINVNTFIKEYYMARNREINTQAEIRRDYRAKVDVEDMNYKAISDLFVEIMICYYSYYGFDKFKQKFKAIFEQFQRIFESYILEVINNEFSDPKTLLEVIRSKV